MRAIHVGCHIGRTGPPASLSSGVMRKLGAQPLLGLILLAAGVVWSLYDWLFVDEGVQYFRKDPSRILVLLAIVAIGTPVLLGYGTLSTQRKRMVTLWTIAALAVAATVFAIHCLYLLACLARLPYQVGILWVCSVAALFPCVIAACLWWAFYRIRRQRSV
jgi:hypothetical protein